ncbi:MAG: DUF3325 domain-containing protein [Janthinobacterium lividum]
MSPAVASLLSLASASTGFALLSLTMARHANQALGATLPRSWRRLLAVSGWGLLVVSLVCCVGAMGWGNAVVAWFGLLTLAALPLSLGLGQAPRAALVAAPVVSLCAAGLLALAR